MQNLNALLALFTGYEQGRGRAAAAQQSADRQQAQEDYQSAMAAAARARAQNSAAVIPIQQQKADAMAGNYKSLAEYRRQAVLGRIARSLGGGGANLASYRTAGDLLSDGTDDLGVHYTQNTATPGVAPSVSSPDAPPPPLSAPTNAPTPGTVNAPAPGMIQKSGTFVIHPPLPDYVGTSARDKHNHSVADTTYITNFKEPNTQAGTDYKIAQTDRLTQMTPYDVQAAAGKGAYETALGNGEPGLLQSLITERGTQSHLNNVTANLLPGKSAAQIAQERAAALHSTVAAQMLPKQVGIQQQNANSNTARVGVAQGQLGVARGNLAVRKTTAGLGGKPLSEASPQYTTLAKEATGLQARVGVLQTALAGQAKDQAGNVIALNPAQKQQFAAELSQKQQRMSQINRILTGGAVAPMPVRAVTNGLGRPMPGVRVPSAPKLPPAKSTNPRARLHALLTGG